MELLYMKRNGTTASRVVHANEGSWVCHGDGQASFGCGSRASTCAVLEPWQTSTFLGLDTRHAPCAGSSLTSDFIKPAAHCILEDESM